MSTKPDLESFLAPLDITQPQISTLTTSLASTYSDLALNSTDQFLATPVTKLPTGSETGEFLAIDLGGSNLRVAFVNLLGAKRVPGRRFSLSSYDERIEKYNQKSWPISEHLKNEKAEDLFAWIGDCLANVIRERYEGTERAQWPKEIPLGITFSFPMKQSTLSEATLLPMGKGFSITSNPDLGALLLAGYSRHCTPTTSAPLPPVRLAAIANDSVTTLISLSYTTQALASSRAAIGLILGTGCNAAAALPPSALSADKVSYATSGGAGGSTPEKVVVNTEWTISGVKPALDAAGVITVWDTRLDAAVSTPGFQPFEYLTAGSYLGEIVRLAVLDYFISVKDFALDNLPRALTAKNGLGTTFLCWNVGPVDGRAEIVRRLNGKESLRGTDNSEGGGWWDEDKAEVLVQVERRVLRRSQGLIAAAIVALLAVSGEVHLESASNVNSRDGANGDTTDIGHSKPDQHSTSYNHSSPNANPKDQKVTELVVAYCGGLICQYKGYVQQVEADLQALRAALLVDKDVEIVLKEASEGGVVGAGVLAGTVVEKGA